MATMYPEMFKQKYPNIKGRKWILSVDKEDLLFWIDLGRKANQYGRLGGQSRARIAKRDKRGRFIKHG